MSVENYKYAPQHFGAYLKDIIPFRKLRYPAFFFFHSVNNLPDIHISLLDAGGGNSKRYGGGLFYLGEMSHRQITYVLNDLLPESVKEFATDIIPLLPNNIHCLLHTLDLIKTWSYPDSSFNAVMMTWTLYWLGNYHQHAIKEMVRVMKPNGLGFITTLSPYDALIKDQIFPNTVSLDDLKKIFPEADEIAEGVSSLQRKPVWIVKFDTFIFRQLQKTPDFVIVEKHPMSCMGKKILAGFNPVYITKLLEDAGCAIILHHRARNIDFPNGYIEGERAHTVLSYVFKKLC